jgi:HSP20 family protein
MAQCNSGPEGPLTASVEKLRQELDRWLDFAVTQGERAMDALRPRTSGRWVPAVDLVETPDEILVTVDLPGGDPQTLDVQLAGNLLTLSGTKPPTPCAEGTIHLSERQAGPYSRSIPLPAPVNPDAVAAEARDGVLRIRIGKSERAKPRHIQVKVEDKPPLATGAPLP